MRNPKFGVWGPADTWGDTARARRSRPIPATRLDTGDHCPDCRAPIWWDTDRNGRMVRLETSGVVHLCEPDSVLRVLEPRGDGERILRQLRRTLNERRMYGEAV
jgi:hypothetical protein